MRYRILGPLRVRRDDRWLAVGPAKQRTLLAVLLLKANQAVSTDRLMAELWDDRPPATAAKVVQVYVSKLRRLLGDGQARRLQTCAPGYRLAVGRGELDAGEFDRLAAEGRAALAAGEVTIAAARLASALRLWHGPVLADVPPTPTGAVAAARLGEQRLMALEAQAEAELACGGHAELLPALEALVMEHPLRERLRGKLMVALYRSGRQAEALAAYHELRATLVEELGVEPGPEMQRLERQILTMDPALSPEPPSQPPQPGPARDGPPPARDVPSGHAAPTFDSGASPSGEPVPLVRPVNPAGEADDPLGEAVAGLHDALRRFSALREQCERRQALTQAAVSASEHSGESAAAVKARLALADGEGRRRRYQEAIEHCEEALAITMELGGAKPAGQAPDAASGTPGGTPTSAPGKATGGAPGDRDGVAPSRPAGLERLTDLAACSAEAVLW